jgi:hypothetical protein
MKVVKKSQSADFPPSGQTESNPVKPGQTMADCGLRIADCGLSPKRCARSNPVKPGQTKAMIGSIFFPFPVFYLLALRKSKA